MSAEIELKFLADPADLAAVVAATPGESLDSRNLIATYYDTPERDLATAQAALRLRDDGRGRRQTLKIGEGFSRREFETPAPFEGLDLDQKALKKVLKPDQLLRLEPIFLVTVKRLTRTLTFDGALIELALDEGEVAANACKQGLCEVELELKDGPAKAVFDLARVLGAAAPLYLSLQSKAAQGGLLSSGRSFEPWTQLQAILSPRHSLDEAFQLMARNALAQIASCAAVLRQAYSVDALHQLRIGVRRLRSAISSFKPVNSDPKRATIQAELKWLLKAFDEARDLDVFARDSARLEVPDTAFAASVDAERLKAHTKAIEALKSQRFRDLTLETMAWVEVGEWLDQRPRKISLERFADKSLTRARKRILKEGVDISDFNDAERHRLRIEAKRLRYTAEGFAPLLKKSERLVNRVKALQDALGDLNDAAVAARIVGNMLLPADQARVARRLLQLRRDQHEALLVATEMSMRQLAK